VCDSYSTNSLNTCVLQLLWLCHELTNLNIPYMESIYLCLLRQIKGGDISTANTRFCDQTLRLLETHRAWLDSYPRLLSTAVYTYLRLIPEHRPMPLAPLQQREIRFVVSMIRQKVSTIVVIHPYLTFRLW
jgi:hypothetical protein